MPLGVMPDVTGETPWPLPPGVDPYRKPILLPPRGKTRAIGDRSRGDEVLDWSPTPVDRRMVRERSYRPMLSAAEDLGSGLSMAGEIADAASGSRLLRGALAGDWRRGVESTFGDPISGPMVGGYRGLGVAPPSGEDVNLRLGLSSPGDRLGPLKGFATEMVANPATAIDLLHGGTRLAMNPAGKALLAGEEGAFSPARLGMMLRRPGASLADIDSPELRSAALSYGPRYGTAAPGLRDVLGAMHDDPTFLHYHGAKLGLMQRGSPVLGEIPTGSRYIGSGVEGFAMETPAGGVVRIGVQPGAQDPANPGKMLGSVLTPRIQGPGILEPARAVTHGPFVVEHMPKVMTADPYIPYRDTSAVRDVLMARGLSEPEALTAGRRLSNLAGEIGDRFFDARPILERQLFDQGMRPTDVHPGNFGFSPFGRALVHDPGAVRWMAPPGPMSVPHAAVPPDRSTARLLEQIGTPPLVRRQIREGIGLSPAQGIPVPREMDPVPVMREVDDIMRQFGADPDRFRRTYGAVTPQPELSPSTTPLPENWNSADLNARLRRMMGY